MVTFKRCVIVKRKGVIWHFFVVSQIFVSERQKNFDICFSNSSENSEMRRWHENFLKKGVVLPKQLLHLYLSKMKPLWSKSLTGLHASHLLELGRRALVYFMTWYFLLKASFMYFSFFYSIQKGVEFHTYVCRWAPQWISS